MADAAPSRPDGGTRLTDLPAREMLLALGGLLAIVLGPVFFVFDVVVGIGASGLVALVINVIFGFLLLTSAGVLRRNLLNGLVLAFLSAVLLLALGGAAGLIGGLFGLVGALLIFVTSYDQLLG